MIWSKDVGTQNLANNNVKIAVTLRKFDDTNFTKSVDSHEILNC